MSIAEVGFATAIAIGGNYGAAVVSPSGVPPPDVVVQTSGPIPIHGAPLGIDLPAYSVNIFHTERRDRLPAWLGTVAAFQILAMEFARESDHRDPLMVMVCQQMANLLFQLVMTGEE